MSFRLKTVLGVAAIEAVLLLVLIWTSMDYLSGSNAEQLAERAHTTARLFATTTKDAVLSTDLASLEAFVEETLKNPDIAYARVISSTDGELAAGGDAAALARAFSPDVDATAAHDGTYDAFAEIREAGHVFGRVEVGLSTGDLGQLLGSARERMVVIALVELVLVAVFSLLLGSFLTRQLSALERAAARVADGDLETMVAVRSSDEVGRVAEAFNAMMAHLRHAEAAGSAHQRELAELNADLEARVARRTARLDAANADLRAANRELEQAQAQLLQSEKMASVGQLAAGVAHEINNPVGFVSSNIDTLARYTHELVGLVHVYREHEQALARDDAVAARLRTAREQVDLDYLEEDLQTLLGETREGIDRVRGIVSDLRDFSHADSGVWQETDLHAGLDSTLNVARNEIKYRATVVREYGELPLVECIQSQLNQVFMNMLVNAAQAMEVPGTITVRTSAHAEEVCVEIEDDGPGISPEVQRRIFDPFFTTKPVGKGTGLGLSVSFGIVARHGGRIEVDSRLGRGTRFSIWLPIRKPVDGDTERSAA
ncbi:MAG: HAMP domain-containing protein [Ectothiorhodospiraceae bacterium]|nr:HAMP domain-containing protein [Ectothiorhodospiraceae bacterium]